MEVAAAVRRTRRKTLAAAEATQATTTKLSMLKGSKAPRAKPAIQICGGDFTKILERRFEILTGGKWILSLGCSPGRQVYHVFVVWGRVA